MPVPRIWQHKVFEGVDWQPMDLFVYGDGTLPVHTEIDDIDILVFKVPDRTLVHSFTGISPGNGTTGPFFNTPVLDDGWKLGPPGYNFKRVLSMATFEAVPVVFEPGQRYRVEIILNGTPEGRLISVHQYGIDGLYGHP